jgi:alanine racemase
MSLTRIEISKTALVNNACLLKSLLPEYSKFVAVVKANAYGHGDVEVVSMLNDYADLFQVDDIEELRRVRMVTDKPVLVLGYVSLSDLEECINLGATLGVYNLETINILEKIATKLNREIRIHLKIDALLGRQGILENDLDVFSDLIIKSKHLKLEAVYSHFSDIEDTNDTTHAKRQYEYLINIKKSLIDNGFPNIKHHISATSGLLSDTKNNWNGIYARVGIGTYGLWPSESLKKRFKNKLKLTPVLRMVSRVAQIKTIPRNFPVGYGQTYVSQKVMKIAVVPVGYSDGYDRCFSNNSNVLIGGKKCPLIGRVAMNMFVVDVSKIKSIKLEDEVVLIGKQGSVEITADDLASKIGTINYEIVARLSALLPKVIVN